jgi:hypothetical protein
MNFSLSCPFHIRPSVKIHAVMAGHSASEDARERKAFPFFDMEA